MIRAEDSNNLLEKLFDATKEAVLIPWTGKLAVTARDLTKLQILEQEVYDTGRYYNSVKVRMDAADLSFEVFSEDCPYSGYLEYGAVKLAPRACFRNAIPRIEAALKDIPMLGE